MAFRKALKTSFFNVDVHHKLIRKVQTEGRRSSLKVGAQSTQQDQNINVKVQVAVNRVRLRTQPERELCHCCYSGG